MEREVRRSASSESQADMVNFNRSKRVSSVVSDTHLGYSKTSAVREEMQIEDLDSVSSSMNEGVVSTE